MRISILGLGIIGSAWARNLLDDGLDVRCWNRTPKNFPSFYPSIHDCVEGANYIVIVVADPPAVKSVLDEINGSLHEGQLVIQSSTISSRWTKQFAQQVHAKGASFLEAPFTGSKPAAEQRKTIFYVGGEEAVIAVAQPVLGRLASTIMHIGPIGSASSLKLAMNLNIAGVAQALCESITLARAEGISDQVYFEALHINASRSGVSDLKEPKLRSRNYAPQFSVKHMAKDLRLALETASEDKLNLNQTASVLQMYEQGMASGWADEDFIGLVRLLEREH